MAANESPEFVGVVIIALAIVALAFLLVAQCNQKYPTPVPGVISDVGQHDLVIRRVAGGAAFLYSDNFALLVQFTLSLGVDRAGCRVEPGLIAYGVYLRAKHADRIRQLYGV